MEKEEWKTMARLRGLSKFGELLIECSTSGDYSSVFASLKDMPPSTVDVEIRCLEIPISITDDSGMERKDKPILLKYFLQAMTFQLDKKVDYELVQAFLSLFLKIHSEMIMKDPDPDLVTECSHLYHKLILSWESLDDTMKKSLCIINYLRSAVI